jgi:hypothetical protein
VAGENCMIGFHDSFEGKMKERYILAGKSLVNIWET